MKKNCVTTVVLLFCMSIVSRGQVAGNNSYTLKQCVETAIDNNLDVLQAGFQMQASNINRKQAILNMFPDLNASVGHGINTGKSIDPNTNGYVNQQIKIAEYALNSGVILFNGFYVQNNIRQNSLAYEASKMDWQQRKDKLTIDIILAYLQVLTGEELLQQAQNQAGLSDQQVKRLEILNNDGAIKPSDLYDVKGQFSGDQLAVVNAKNALERAKLNLCQLMNIRYDKQMKLERIDLGSLALIYPNTPSEIYQKALDDFALIRSAELRRKSAERAIKASRGQLFPTLSLNGGAFSRYSSSDNAKYGKQLDNNIATSVSLNLRIPIFNSLFARNRVRLAEIDAKNYSAIEQTTKTQLQQNIEQAYVDMTSAQERYKVLMEQVSALTESFRAAEIRFNEGVGTSVDYLIAKNNLDRSNNSFIIAKYDYVLKTKILDYYQGTLSWQ